MESFSPATYTPTAADRFSISGAECQILTVALSAKQKVTSEPGAFMFSSSDVKTEAECGSCTRTLVGEACCKTIFENKGGDDGFVALTPNFPAKIIPVSLPTVGGVLIAKKGAYMCHVGDVSLTASFDCCSLASCCGGLGWARQQLAGSGTVFVNAGGVVLTKVLEKDETIVVDTDALVAFQTSVKVSVRPLGGPMVCCCSGEGCFNTTLTGPGLVIVESMSFARYKAAVAPPVQNNDGGGDSGGDGGGGGD